MKRRRTVIRLEKIAIWRETGLFTEQADGSRGYFGFVRGAFVGDEISIDAGQLHIPAEAQYEYETLLCFLRSADASFLLKSAAAMTAVCSERLQCHIPYAFGRECFGFRVLSEHCAWYIACTPWNTMKPFAIYAYDRTKLMTALAKEIGLPEACYGVTPYSGERMRIRYGDNSFESFPQYGQNREGNKQYAAEQNKTLNVTKAKQAAMEGGVIYGWDTPAADPCNYDESGYFRTDAESAKEKRK